MFNNINEATNHFKGMSLAVESMLAEGAVEDLLASAKAKIESSCTTVDECDAYLANIESETDKYNNALNEIKLSAEELKTGQIDQATFGARVKPYMDELKNSCEVLDLAVNNSNTEGLSDSDIVNLKTFLIGVREIIIRRRDDLSRELGGDTPTDTMESLVNFLSGNTIATEGKFTDAVKGKAGVLKEKLRSKKKEASELVKDARDDIKSDDLADATKKLSKAKKLYQDMGRQYSNLKEWSKKQVTKIDTLIDKIKAKIKRKSKAATESFFDYEIMELDMALEAALDEEVEDLADEIVEESEEEETDSDDEDSDDDDDEESLEAFFMRLER